MIEVAGQMLLSDADGTVHDGYIMHPVYDAFDDIGFIERGSAERLREIHRRHVADPSDIDFPTFVNDTLNLGATLLKGCSVLTANKLAEEVIADKNFEWFGYVRPLMTDLREAKIKTALITAAPQFVARAVKKTLGMDRVYSSRYGTQNKGAEFTGKMIVKMDGKRKAAVATSVTVGAKHTAALGDSDGDIGMFTNVNKPVAVQPTPELRKFIDSIGKEMDITVIEDPSQPISIASLGFQQSS